MFCEKDGNICAKIESILDGRLFLNSVSGPAARLSGDTFILAGSINCMWVGCIKTLCALIARRIYEEV